MINNGSIVMAIKEEREHCASVIEKMDSIQLLSAKEVAKAIRDSK